MKQCNFFFFFSGKKLIIYFLQKVWLIWSDSLMLIVLGTENRTGLYFSNLEYGKISTSLLVGESNNNMSPCWVWNDDAPPFHDK